MVRHRTVWLGLVAAGALTVAALLTSSGCSILSVSHAQQTRG